MLKEVGRNFFDMNSRIHQHSSSSSHAVINSMLFVFVFLSVFFFFGGGVIFVFPLWSIILKSLSKCVCSINL